MSHGKEITFAEMFSGIGGFRLGLERSNELVEATANSGAKSCKSKSKGRRGQRKHATHSFRCVWANDWEYADYRWVKNRETGELEWKGSKNKCREVYTKHWNDGTYIDADIKTVDAHSIPDHDLLTTGFPCKAFSVAGKRGGFSDTSGTLFHDVARVAEAKRPKLLLLENVKGILSAKAVTENKTPIEGTGGYVFARILQILEDLGYLLEWQVLNSKHFGVPQNRERVFLVGHLAGQRARKIFPIGETDEVAQGKSGGGTPQMEGISATIDRNYWKGPDGKRTMIYWKNSAEEWVEENREASLALKGQSDLCRQPLILADRTRTLAGKGRNLESPKPLTNALSGVQKDNLVIHSLFPRTGNPKQGGVGHLMRITPESYALDSHNTMAIERGARIRRLTPVECERLQGFPDGWTEGVSDTQRYKLLGNAVTVNVVEFLGRKLRECLS